MQQSTRRILILVAATLVGGGGLFIAACSSDSGTTSGGLPTVDSGKDTGSSGNPVPDSGGGDAGGPDADCSKAPTLHDNSAGFFCPYQAKVDGGDAPDCTQTQICCSPGIPSYSDAGFPSSFCATSPKNGDPTPPITQPDDRETVCGLAAVGGPGGPNWETGNKFNSMWECADKSNCTVGEVCCAVTDAYDIDAGEKANIGNNSDKTDIPTVCGAQSLFRSNGTKCITGGCTAGTSIRTCSLNDPCTTGTCTPFAGSATSKSSTRDLGYCKL